MFNAARSMFHSATLGEPLPRVAALQRLYDVNVIPRRGEFMMIAGEPGTQKSGFALWYTQEMNLPTLYFSADMSAFQASLRLAARATGQSTEQIEANIEAGGMDTYLNLLETSQTVFCFDSHPNLDDMEEMLEAYVEVYDAWPEVIVVDNLMDVESEHAEEYGGLKAICAWGHDLTRVTGASVIYLHHMSESNQHHNSKYPHRRKDIIQKVATKPELILSVALDENQFRISCVKQRMGPSDSSGETYITLTCDAKHATFSPYRGYVPSGGNYGQSGA